MAAIVGRVSRQGLLKVQTGAIVSKGNFSVNSVKDAFKKLATGKKIAVGITGAATAGLVGTATALTLAVSAKDLELHPPKMPWSHKGVLDSIDHGSARRGYQVYKQVCAACHSMKYMYYRNLVGSVLTDEEARAEAAEAQINDGPDETGAMFKRPGKLSDKFPDPYDNEEAAKAANNGALPPDLSFMANAREEQENYIFALLTGYCDAPAGVTVGEGQAYNPYFPGGAIGMPQQLYNDGIEYDDGTPATVSQMAKDVCTFMRLTAEPEHDERKRVGMMLMGLTFVMFCLSYYYKRHKWAAHKAMKYSMRPKAK